MRIGVCTTPDGVNRPPEGLDFIEGTVAGLLCPREDEAAFQKIVEAVRSARLPVEAANCLIPGDLKTTGPDVNVESVDAYIDIVCRRAAVIGLKRIVFGSGGSRRVPEGFSPQRASDQLVEHLRRWGPKAAEAGFLFVLEPLNRGETNIVNGVDEGADVVGRADHPNVRLLVDTYHMAKEAESPDAIRRAGELICHAHCAEGDGRGPLGTLGEDHRPYFRALKDIGYDGRVAIEAKWNDFAGQLPAAVVELERQITSA